MNAAPRYAAYLMTITDQPAAHVCTEEACATRHQAALERGRFDVHDG